MPSGGPGYSPSGTYPTNLITDLSGIVTFTLAFAPLASPPNCTATPGPNACDYEVTTTFVSSPVPEASAAILTVIGLGALLICELMAGVGPKLYRKRE